MNKMIKIELFQLKNYHRYMLARIILHQGMPAPAWAAIDRQPQAT
jgi:hypothetical protein